MKRISLIIIIFQFSLIALSQRKTEVYFGESGRNDGSSDLLEMYDKGYYIVGGFESSDEFSNGWNIKTDINLEMVYNKVLEHDISTVAPFAAVSDTNGNIYECGFTTYPAIWPFITKLDSCGNKVWCKILDYSDEWFDYGWAEDILITEKNEIVLLTDLESEEETEIIFLIGLSLDGDLLWKQGYASKIDYPWITAPGAYSVELINHEYYISGFCYWPYPNDTTHVFLRPLFIGIDSLFNEKWILPFAALDSVYGDAFNTIGINDSILMGIGMRRLDDPEESGLLMFFKTDGTELGYKEITKDQIGLDVSQIYFTDVRKINNELFIASSPIGYNNEVFPAGEIIIDSSAIIYNFQDRPGTIGNMNMTKTYDGNFVFTASYPEGKSDNDIYVYKIDENLNDVPFDPTPHTYDSLCPGGIQSGTIDLTSCFVWTNISDTPSPKEYFESIRKIPVKAYPNPVTDGSITFEFKNTEYHQNMELRCFDIFGELIHKEKIYKYQGESLVDVGTWGNGMYVAVVYNEGMPVGSCKFVIQ